MTFAYVALAAITAVAAFAPPPSAVTYRTRVRPATVESSSEKIAAADAFPKNKVERIKLDSKSLREPVASEFADMDTVSVSHDAYQILKFHGSYMQDRRMAGIFERRPKGSEKEFSFMLRLKVPGGEVPPELHRKLDDLSREYGFGHLRATTRQAWQLHGVVKGNLATVINALRDCGSSTVGACGDVSRNVMCTPAPFATPEYAGAREVTKIMAELFKPQSSAFTEVWGQDKDGEKEKIASIEYWRKDIDDAAVQAAYVEDRGNGIIVDDKVEPLYGKSYLPRKFKIGVTVPGDNSIDIYINDIGIVVLTDDATGAVKGYNVMVGGGMGRTHGKDTTFARTADHLGFVETKADLMELCKAILAAQRDHGNREIRANARMKYLVHTMGINGFRKLVETYFGQEVQPWAEMKPWRYSDWMGWHDAGDGTLFLGLNIEQGRVKDVEGHRMKTLLRTLVDKYDMHTVLLPNQSLMLKGIKPSEKADVEAMIAEHGVKQIEEIDPITRLSMACPAMPMCGLAVTEAERTMPEYISRVRALLDKLNLPGEEFIFRVTGCPNGCARPYMAELAFVGDGPKSYQVWVGGSSVGAEHTGAVYKDRVKIDLMEQSLEPVFAMFRDQREGGVEFFGDFCNRVGVDAIKAFAETYTLQVS